MCPVRSLSGFSFYKETILPWHFPGTSRPCTEGCTEVARRVRQLPFARVANIFFPVELSRPTKDSMDNRRVSTWLGWPRKVHALKREK